MANSFTGTFSTPAKQAEFMAITTSVADNQFENETGLTSISLPEATTIGSQSFQSSPLTSISLPKAQVIASWAFQFSKLTSLSLPEVTTIGRSAFASSSLTSISLPKATTIGNYAFTNIKNAASTTVILQEKFNTNAEKDRIFDNGWNHITFKVIKPAPKSSISMGYKWVNKPFEMKPGKKLVKITMGAQVPKQSGVRHEVSASNIDLHNTDQYLYIQDNPSNPSIFKQINTNNYVEFNHNVHTSIINKYKNQPSAGFYYIYFQHGSPQYVDIHFLTDNHSGQVSAFKKLESIGVNLDSITNIYYDLKTATDSSGLNNIRIHNFYIETNDSVYIFNERNMVKHEKPKTLTLQYPWSALMSFNDGVTKSDSTLGTLYKVGYVFNSSGNGHQYDQNFDSSPFRLKYIRHFDHAIGEPLTAFSKSAIKGDKKLRMRYVAGSVSAYGGTVSATSSDRGLAEGQLEFWNDGGKVKFKLNYNKQYIAHNGTPQRHYPVAISRVLSVGDVKELTSSWTSIAFFTYNTRGGYWAKIFIRLNGNSIEIAQQCDWHGASVEFGAFAILGYEVQR